MPKRVQITPRAKADKSLVKPGMYNSPSKAFQSPMQPKTKPGYMSRAIGAAAEDELKGSVGLGKAKGSATAALGLAKKAASYKTKGKYR